MSTPDDLERRFTLLSTVARCPRRAGLGTGKRVAGEARDRWTDAQAEREESPGRWGWGENDVATARTLAGEPDEENGA
ncbi:hypothetical protein AB0J63_20060 [Streptosporangium canum]|uniref:hypothetical protein n=1 Tax=Streptosporangium canum TaxID=324952 RepID=UPI00343826C1